MYLVPRPHWAVIWGVWPIPPFSNAEFLTQRVQVRGLLELTSTECIKHPLPPVHPLHPTQHSEGLRHGEEGICLARDPRARERLGTPPLSLAHSPFWEDQPSLHPDQELVEATPSSARVGWPVSRSQFFPRLALKPQASGFPTLSLILPT